MNYKIDPLDGFNDREERRAGDEVKAAYLATNEPRHILHLIGGTYQAPAKVSYKYPDKSRLANKQ